MVSTTTSSMPCDFMSGEWLFQDPDNTYQPADTDSVADASKVKFTTVCEGEACADSSITCKATGKRVNDGQTIIFTANVADTDIYRVYHTDGGAYDTIGPIALTTAGKSLSAIALGNFNGASARRGVRFTLNANHLLQVGDSITVSGFTTHTIINGTWNILATPAANQFEFNVTGTMPTGTPSIATAQYTHASRYEFTGGANVTLNAGLVSGAKATWVRNSHNAECSSWVGNWAFTYSTGIQRVSLATYCGQFEECQRNAKNPYIYDSTICVVQGTRVGDRKPISILNSTFGPTSWSYIEVRDPDGTDGTTLASNIYNTAITLGASFVAPSPNTPVNYNLVRGDIDNDCIDADNDSYGVNCLKGADCDDTNPAVNPGASELCDGIDNDCDSFIDDGITFTTYYRDADNDTYGNKDNATSTCTGKPAGYVDNGTADCNDNVSSIHPGATEVCNDKIDNDCDNQTDENCVIVTTASCQAWLGKWIFNYDDNSTTPGDQQVIFNSVCDKGQDCMPSYFDCKAFGTRLSDNQPVAMIAISFVPNTYSYYEAANPGKGDAYDSLVAPAAPAYSSFTVAPANWGLLSGSKTADNPSFDNVSSADVVSYDGDGTVTVHKMSGTAPVNRFNTISGIAGNILATGNFNGDNSTDILAKNGSVITMYLMNGLTVTSSAAIAISGTFQGVGDFNGDGKTDIVGRTAGGTIGMYFMNGTSIASKVNFYYEPNAAWQIIAMADFNRDFKADILWRNTSTGKLYLMLMNGATITSKAVIYYEPNLDWRVVAIGDFNGDGRADILYHNSSNGKVYEIQMNGLATSTRGVIYQEQRLEWQVVTARDYNGDAKADILWKNTETGKVHVLLMNGMAVSDSATVFEEPTTYTIVK